MSDKKLTPKELAGLLQRGSDEWSRDECKCLLATIDADRTEIARLSKIEDRAKEWHERLKFDSSDRAYLVDNILTGATYRDGIRTPLEGGKDG